MTRLSTKFHFISLNEKVSDLSYRDKEIPHQLRKSRGEYHLDILLVNMTCLKANVLKLKKENIPLLSSKCRKQSICTVVKF